MNMSNFAVIIISHGRPSCPTAKTLQECGYTGRTFILIDDEDKEQDSYLKNYGDKICIFHKTPWFDIGDNFDGPNGIATFARNACFDVAKEKCLKSFLMIDDDLKQASVRYLKDGRLLGKKCTDLDSVFFAASEIVENTKTDCIGFGLPMDYIGGSETFNKPLFETRRHVMNAYMFKSDSAVRFHGRYSEDSISPVQFGKTGAIFLNNYGVQLQFDVFVPDGRKNMTGGCVDTYRTTNTYVMMAYSVMFCPDSIKMRIKGDGFNNSVSSRCSMPFILSERWKK